MARSTSHSIVALLLAGATFCAGNAVAQVPAGEGGFCPALLDHEFNRLQTGQPETLCQYRGKVLLIVNTASYCGYTHQYEGLEALYRKYKDRGLVVLGFPSNDFGAQEPGSNREIAQFCRLTYGVQFPMFEKTSVASLKTNPLYAELAARTGETPKWNFHKYLIDRNGNPAATFASKVEPDNSELVGVLEKLLAAKPAPQKG
jgi:glutathione peroxidase